MDIASSSRRLLKAASDTYDLYRAIVPVAHSALISTVPSIGMQLSNDCLYAAHEGTRINTDTVDSTKLGQDDKMAQWKPVNALRTFAHHILDEQIVSKSVSAHGYMYKLTRVWIPGVATCTPNGDTR